MEMTDIIISQAVIGKGYRESTLEFFQMMQGIMRCHCLEFIVGIHITIVQVIENVHDE